METVPKWGDLTRDQKETALVYGYLRQRWNDKVLPFSAGEEAEGEAEDEGVMSLEMWSQMVAIFGEGLDGSSPWWQSINT